MTNTLKAGDKVVLTEINDTGLTADYFRSRTGADTDTVFTVDYVTSSGMVRLIGMPGIWAPGRFALYAEQTPKLPRKGTRYDQVLQHLTSGLSLTQGEATVLGYGTRLAATVHDLKKRGHKIVTTMKEDLHGNPYAEYALLTRNSRNGNRKAA